jgi:hypothetical protein
MMKRSRLVALSATLVLLAGSALVGGLSLRGGNAHADGGGLAPNEVPLDTLTHYTLAHSNLPAAKHQNGHIAQGIPGIDSIPTFNGKYHADGFDPTGNSNKQWVYNMVGNLPQLGGTTTIRAPIIPVSVDLLAGDGSTLFHVDATQDQQPALNSPVFQNAPYSSSSNPTQFTDAIQRAEFASTAKSDWHTLLQPVAEPGVTIQLPWGSYQYARFSSGPRSGQIAFVVVDYYTFFDLMFPTTYSWPPDPSSVMGAAEASGEITPHDITTFLTPPLFAATSTRAAAGFHNIDIEPGDASNGNLPRVFNYNYVSWVPSPGILVSGITIQDAVPLSHEMAETFDDPFVGTDADLNTYFSNFTGGGAHNITPWWAARELCDDLLETGDIIEFLPNAIGPITMNGMTYHVQSVALLQWFEGMTPSDASGGAYSYPDTSVLTTANPPNMPPGCGH